MPAWMSDSCAPALAKRVASSLARPSATWRAEGSLGRLVTSTIAFRNWLAA